ncbi:tryptophan-rich sensory protein [Algibacter miyuki]|uniref:Tryptophan-rich sensory protein n=1 Tax=Algibacter miyuki TaxID=1306933 RepID=A0ABV5GWN6_9FLAO|nr:tryptophan-rich sensory protein [Algibacter miyuki]MDN3664301.1 tryptophan-rich sensory protein [Algibacter miyuki]
MKKQLQIINGVAFVCVLVMNYLSNTGLLNNTTIGEVSKDYNTLFTPAGYAFSIWGIIYLLLLGFIVYQGRSLFVKVRNDDFILTTGWWFLTSCIANCAWIVTWIYGYTLISSIFIFIILFALLQIVLKNKMELFDASISVILFLWWPFVIYSGWITVASIANVSAVLVKYNWDGFGLSPTFWTIALIGIATIINLMVTWKRNMREFALVGAWALIAIYVANSNANTTVAYTAGVAAAILIISSSTHAFINRKTNPAIKCKEYLDARKN